MARLAVALSGGVDSTIAARRLLDQGHELVGLSLRLDQGSDAAPQAGARAAAELGIDHHVVEASQAFEDLVVAPAARAYAAGRTPNPCAVCNAALKLPFLWAAAQKLGCAALATGHYARLEDGPGGPVLAEAADAKKSQSYFLAQVPSELLARLVFPLSGLTKARVRAEAARLGLSAARRPESQDACFLPSGGWDELVRSRDLARPGVLEDDQGNVLGRHDGLHRFTVGQRRGLGLAWSAPLYVLGLDGERAAVRVGPADKLEAQGLKAQGARWYLDPGEGRDLTVRLRYSHAGVGCRVRARGGEVEAKFEKPQRAVAPGQLAVFLQAGRVAGSAWINEAVNQN